jgi:hypothetical protein
MDNRKLRFAGTTQITNQGHEENVYELCDENDMTVAYVTDPDADKEMVKRWNAPQHKYPVGAEVQVIGDDSPQWIDGIVTEREITETKDGTSVLWTVKAPVRGGYWKNSKPSIIRNRP